MKQFFAILTMCAIVYFTHAQNPTLEWARSIGNISNDVVSSSAMDQQGNVYAVGQFYASLDIAPGAPVSTLTSAGERDIYIKKFDADGNLVWVRQIGGTMDDYPNRILLDAQGNLLIGGFFEDVMDADPGSGVFELTSNGLHDIFIIKLDSDGEFIWATNVGGSSSDFISNLAVSNSGEVFATGRFSETVDFDAGPGVDALTAAGSFDGFVLKLDADGDFGWVKAISGSSNVQGTSIAVDGSGAVYTCGQFAETVDFDPGSGTTTLTATGTSDAFIQKLDSEGNLLFARSLGGPGLDFPGSLAIDELDHIFLAGSFELTADLDPGNDNNSFTSMGGLDCYVQQLDSEGNSLWIHQISSTGNTQVSAMNYTSRGDLYVSGVFYGSTNFDPGASSVTVPAVGEGDGFIVKLESSSGDFQWVRQVGGPRADVVAELATNNRGELAAVGFFESTVDFDPDLTGLTFTSAGSKDGFIMKLSECLPSTITQVANTLTSTMEGISYQWIDCENGNAPIAGATDQSFEFTANGSYAVVVAQNNCIDTSACVLVDNVGLQEQVLARGVSLYPNPSNGLVNLTFSQVTPATIQVFDPTGKLVHTQTVSTGQGQQIALPDAAGLYLIQVSTEQERATFRVVKE